MLTIGSDQKISQNFIEQRLLPELRNNISPFGLEVDCLAIRRSSGKLGKIPLDHQNVVREMQVWSKYLRHRPISTILFKDPFVAFNASSLSQIVSSVGENFRLLNSRREEHAAVIQFQHVTEDRLALLKDLDFNHIKINLNETLRSESVVYVNRLLEEFQFPYISFVVQLDGNDVNYLAKFLTIFSEVQPETIIIDASSKNGLNGRDCCFAELSTRLGYIALSSTTVVRYRSKLIGAPRDKLGLGPNACSRFGDCKITNFGSLFDYADSLKNASLPIFQAAF